ncbi:GxxExxY protein [Paramagnetospirillum kuznetsovii]|uniref:GxxExxY protein n=2 Tax=Paramagnetospirillum kuznetsovii TaxID=2053833 RepID=A0A364P3T5_9PROT|nr:GxxExxY protein [Paramagnetospirillum kuznetsovii]
MDGKDPLTHRILAAAFEVSNSLGHGFLEVVYQKALVHELILAGMTVDREKVFKVIYKGADIGTYIADMVVDEQVVVELKSVEALNPAHTAQCLNYLRASGLKTGLLLNFGKPRIEYKRLVL